MANVFFRVNSDKVSPVVSVDEILHGKDENSEIKTEEIKQRAKNLSIEGSRNSKLLEKAVEFQIKQDKALIHALKNDWYNFVMQIAGFSNESITKFYKDDSGDKNQAQPLANTPQIGQIAQINAAVSGEGGGQDGKELGDYLKTRQYFLQTPEVRGYIFLTPICYSHVCEAVSLLENMCHTKINVDNLVGSQHATMFARLVSTRIQISRFLSGRYYSLSANYDRLRKQQFFLVQYFKKNLSSNTFQRTYKEETAAGGLFAQLEGL